MGTYLFAAPEALQDAASVDPRADVYSLAMTMVYALAHGRISLEGKHQPQKWITALLVSDHVKAALIKALSHERTFRQATVTHFCDEVAQGWGKARTQADDPAAQDRAWYHYQIARIHAPNFLADLPLAEIVLRLDRALEELDRAIGLHPANTMFRQERTEFAVHRRISLTREDKRASQSRRPLHSSWDRF